MLFCIFCAPAVSQTDPVPPIRKALAKYCSSYPQEKVYLQLDKQSYFSTETIWFSGYVTCQSKPSTISNILYVELFNNKGLIINRAMLPIKSGFLSGEFLLNAGLPAGDYFIRAYTAWMLNFNGALFFYRRISVVDKPKPGKTIASASRADFSVQFFPEGGNLVSRLTSVVAFKAIDTNGAPIAVSGKIINNIGDTVALLRTVHDGMGSFIIHCTPQTLYTALVTANGITKKIPLPAVQPSGVVLHTETKNNGIADSIFFHISRSGINKEKFENLILCAQMENQFSVTKIHFNESTFNDPLDTIVTAPYPLLLNNFGKGVLQLQVLNEAGNVLAKRLLFLYGRKPGIIQLHQTNGNEKNNFLITVPHDYKGTIAVSVTDADNEADSNDKSSIQPAIYLSAAINTVVKNPEWYFDENPEAARYLDVLLMTCKSARANMQTILSGDEKTIKYLPEKSITLKGRAFEINGARRRPLANGSLFLILKAAADSVSMPFSVNTDSQGLFVLPAVSFRDTAAIYVQTGTKAQGNNIEVEFYKNIFDSIARNKFVVAPTVLNTKLYNINIESRPGDITTTSAPGMLQEVTVTAKTKTHMDSVLAKYASGMFANPGSWAQTLDLTNDPITAISDQNVLSWLNGKVAGLNYSYSNGKPIIYWRFSNVIVGLSNYDQLKLNAPAFFLNEALLSAGLEGYDGAIDLLSGIRMADVALIRVYKPGTMPNVPDNGPHGSVAIWLKNGTENDKPPAKINFEKTLKAGFKINRQFVASVDAQSNSTLYWNPALPVDATTHTATFNFSNDKMKRFRVIAEGIDENGKIISINEVVNNN